MPPARPRFVLPMLQAGAWPPWQVDKSVFNADRGAGVEVAAILARIRRDYGPGVFGRLLQ